MTQAVTKLVGEFEALPEAEQHQALAELLRLSAAGTHDLPDDQDLMGAADQLFQELDRREQRR